MYCIRQNEENIENSKNKENLINFIPNKIFITVTRNTKYKKFKIF